MFLTLERDMAVGGGSQGLGINNTKAELKDLKKSLQGGRADAIAADMVSDDNLLDSKFNRTLYRTAFACFISRWSNHRLDRGPCSLEPSRLRIPSRAIFLV